MYVYFIFSPMKNSTRVHGPRMTLDDVCWQLVDREASFEFLSRPGHLVSRVLSDMVMPLMISCFTRKRGIYCCHLQG